MLKSIQTIANKLKRKIGAKAQLKVITKQLLELSNSLELSMSGVEDKFLDLGQKCQSIFSKTETLKSQVLTTTGFSGNKTDGSGIAGVGDFARHSVQKLATYQGEIANNLKILDSGCDHLQILSNMCADTDKVALLLNVIALNIAVESNRSEESREMFMVFVTEIKELSEKISHVSQDLLYDSEATRKKQIHYKQEISENLVRLQKLTGTAENVVNQSVKEIEELMDKSLISLERAGGCSSDIYSLVSSIVMAMQSHDIVRQQIEHVVTAINDAEQLCETSATNLEEPGIIEKTMGKIHSILTLQNAQIKSAIAEIDSVYKNILNAFEGIEVKVDELLSCISGLSSKRSTIETENHSFSILLSGFEDLNKLLADADLINASMSEAAGDASTSTSGLLKHVGHVQSISLDLHRKALNAIIKAAHLGEMGRALEVFAQEVTTASNDSNTFADKVVAHIESISSLTAQMSTESEGKAQNEKSDLSLTTSIDSLSRSYDDFLENSEATLTMSKVLAQSIAETKSALSFISEFSDDLKIQMGKSEEILDKLILTNEFYSDVTDLTETSARYTMESERLVHLSLFGNTDAEDEQADSEDAPELFINETDELTDSENISGQSSDIPPSEEAAVGDDNEAPDDLQESDDEFDDNIELF